MVGKSGRGCAEWEPTRALAALGDNQSLLRSGSQQPILSIKGVISGGGERRTTRPRCALCNFCGRARWGRKTTGPLIVQLEHPRSCCKEAAYCPPITEPCVGYCRRTHHKRSGLHRSCPGDRFQTANMSMTPEIGQDLNRLKLAFWGDVYTSAKRLDCPRISRDWGDAVSS